MSAKKTLVYLVLGPPGSGRREIVADMIEGGIASGDRPAVLLSEGEAQPVEADKRLGRIERWRLDAGNAIDGALPADADIVFFISDGRRNPVDQVEAFKVWLAAQGAELGRIMCVVDCALAEKHPPLLVWYDACIHFSDAVLLNRREGVGNKWISDFQSRYKDQFYPCIIELVKTGRVRNPALILEPQALRVSHAFDAEQDWVAVGAEDEVLDEEDAEDGEEVEMVLAEDPYFARCAGGRREKEIPDIAKFLTRD